MNVKLKAKNYYDVEINGKVHVMELKSEWNGMLDLHMVDGNGSIIVNREQTPMAFLDYFNKSEMNLDVPVVKISPSLMPTEK